MQKRILIVGGGGAGKSVSALEEIKKMHGDDIIVITPEEAKQHGLTTKQIPIIPTPKLAYAGQYKSGKQKRRERRKRERQAKYR